MENTDYRKFIVLGRSRTGSNLVVSALNSHPSIECSGEVFAQLEGRTHDEVLSSVFCPKPDSIAAVGLKIFYYHPLDDKSGDLWGTLKGTENLTVIHLKRRNVLRTLVSLKIAYKTKVWEGKHSDQPIPVDERRVEFTDVELLEGFRKTKLWEQEFDDYFADSDLMQICYEDFADKPEENLQNLCERFGVEPGTLATDMRRQNPESLSSLIRNYDELKEWFLPMGWSEYFED